MTLPDALAVIGTALGGALAALRGRNAWVRSQIRRDRIERCAACGHRCTYCRAAAVQLSDPPGDDDDTPRRFPKGR